jgi:3-ketosteroid 9alpha-monooxygenase subunit B
MVDPASAGVSEREWREATHHCHPLRVARVIPETHDSVSIVLEVPDAFASMYTYRAGQFLSFKVPYGGRVLTRSYSLSSSPDTDARLKVTVKRVAGGRISNWMNEQVREGSQLMVVPPAGHFVLADGATRDVTLFAGGSGITPCISIVKSGLATTARRLQLIYANRDARSIIFERELEALRADHPTRLEVIHRLDDRDGFLGADDVADLVAGRPDSDFYLCGPAPFMEVVERALHGLGVDRAHIHVEHFVSPPDHDEPSDPLPATAGETAPASITIVLDGKTHDVPYEPGERVLAAAQRAGLDPPFSCEEGYCSCCMAKLASGQVSMAANDCLTQDLLDEGWVLTCQSRCVSTGIKIEYPD